MVWICICIAVPNSLTEAMQTAGEKCPHCEDSIIIETEGTWCATCKTVFHRECLAEADLICPKCQRSFDDPEQYFVNSVFCPDCFRPVPEGKTRCEACGGLTHFDNREEYEKRLAMVRAEVGRDIFIGITELILAILCLLFVPGLVKFLGAVVLGGDGIRRLVMSGHASKFR